jgi:serine/threonine protein kinase
MYDQLQPLKLTELYIVQFLGTFNDGKDTYIVTEFMALGNALDLLKHDVSAEIPVKELLFIARHAASGMAYLASKKIVHRDLALSITTNNYLSNRL